ncbi:MerR family DNA-binding transcriptional regulator [Microbacterium sp.]|uniref:MerR family DNA-binding transcriptional regulator n=1 Tax=Microbacterium sp. TaxID=51671 RepID=UPI0026059DCF|nr:MerR family DNA-binding transcriptional regulator [Microbacterium sp.]
MKIGELSRRSGVSARSLRYYEQHGLIASERAANGYRVYGDDVVERAHSAHLLFELGVHRELVRAVLACASDVSVEVHRATRDQLAEVRDRMGDRITELSRAHEALSSVVDRVSLTKDV